MGDTHKCVMTRTFAAFCSAMVFASALLSAAPAAESPYGVCSHVTRWGFSYRDESCRWIAATGIRHLRADFDWSAIQPAPDAPYNWERFDRAIESAERQGVQILPIVYAFPSWAQPSLDHLDDWARFVEAFTARYGDRIPDIEIWNEENGGGGSPDWYAKILQAAYPAAKRGNPGVRVIFGGTAGTDLKFIEGVYRQGAAPFFDVMCVHPYEVLWNLEALLPEKLAALRDLMARHGDGNKPIVISELGWSTHEPSIDGDLLRAGLAAARPDLKSWRCVYAAVETGPDGRPYASTTRMIEAALPPGSTLEACLGARLRERLAAGDVDAVIYPFGEAFPVDTFEEVFAFVRDGGTLVDFGGAPMWYRIHETESGKFVNAGQDDSARRDRLRMGFEAFWTDDDIPMIVPVLPTEAAKAAGYSRPPAGESAHRFQTPANLLPGDEFIPLMTGHSKSGRELVGSSVTRLHGDLKGQIVIGGTKSNGFNLAASEEEQAAFLIRAVAICLAEGVEQFFWYEFRGDEKDPNSNQSHFGLTHSNFTPKPAWGAYRNFILMRPAGSVQTVGQWRGDGLFCPQWTRPDGTKAGVVWKTGETEKRELRFASGGAGGRSVNIRFRNYTGKEIHPVRVSDGAYIVPVGEYPVFFEGGEFIFRQ